MSTIITASMKSGNSTFQPNTTDTNQSSPDVDSQSHNNPNTGLAMCVPYLLSFKDTFWRYTKDYSIRYYGMRLGSIYSCYIDWSE